MITLIVACTAIAASVGLALNGYILLVLLWQRRFQTANHLLLIHLAIVDIFFCFVILLGNTPLSLVHEHQVPKALGVFQGVLWSVLPAVLAWTICGLSCDRYVAICAPFKYTKLVSSRRAIYFIIIVWSSALCFALTPILFDVCNYQLSEPSASFTIVCRASAASNLTTISGSGSSSSSENLATAIVDQLFAVSFTTYSMLLPVSLIAAFNLHILLIARYQRHQIVNAIYEITLRATATAVGGRKDSRSTPASSTAATASNHANHAIQSKQRGGDALLILLVVSYLFLLSPSHIVFLVESFKPSSVSSVPSILVSMTTLMLAVIPCVNAYVYGVKSQLIRSEFKRLFQRYLYQQQASIEVSCTIIKVLTFSSHEWNVSI